MSSSGSANSAEEFAAVAILIRPRGNKGELIAESLSSKPGRFAQLRRVYLLGSPYEVERIWEHDGAPIFKFRGVDSISAAEALRGAEVCIPAAERVPLEPDEYFQSDLIGFEVRDVDSGRAIGRVTGWEEYGGPALLAIDGGRLLIPFVKAICPEIDPEARVIRALLPAGLEDLAE